MICPSKRKGFMQKILVALLALVFAIPVAFADAPHASLTYVRKAHHRVQRHHAHKAAKHKAHRRYRTV
jgi:hypothetical protein